MHGTLSVYLPNNFSTDGVETISVHIGKSKVHGSPIIIPSIITASHGTPFASLEVGGSGGGD